MDVGCLVAQSVEMWDRPRMPKQPPEVAPGASPVAHGIRHRMIDRGVSMRELARASGQGDTFIRDILVGKAKRPNVEGLKKVAAYLECTVDDLSNAPHQDLSNVNLLPSSKDISDLIQQPNDAQLLRIWGRLDRDFRERLLLQIIDRLRRQE